MKLSVASKQVIAQANTFHEPEELEQEHITLWIRDHPLSATHIDCITTMMLKIIAAKCKMNTDEKFIMRQLYDQVKGQPGKLLEPDLRPLISQALDTLDEDGALYVEMKDRLLEKRLRAETMISHPVMHEFTAMIRQHGLFE